MNQTPAQEPRPKPGLLLTRLIPNMLTLFSLCSGLSAIRYALQDRWEMAVIAIIIAGIFDLLDGRVARMLHSTSKFGAELDSLSDLISFGLAPALTVYRWVLVGGEELGWLAVLAFVVCTALRLARFNTMLDDPNMPAWQKSYFTGMPTPGAAGLALLPLVWCIALDSNLFRIPALTALWLILLAALMVSRWPTFALKGHRISRRWIVPLMVTLGLAAAQLATNPWRTVGCAGLFYFSTFPVSWIQFHRRLRREHPS